MRFHCTYGLLALCICAPWREHCTEDGMFVFASETYFLTLAPKLGWKRQTQRIGVTFQLLRNKRFVTWRSHQLLRNKLTLSDESLFVSSVLLRTLTASLRASFRFVSPSLYSCFSIDMAACASTAWIGLTSDRKARHIHQCMCVNSNPLAMEAVKNKRCLCISVGAASVFKTCEKHCSWSHTIETAVPKAWVAKG